MPFYFCQLGITSNSCTKSQQLRKQKTSSANNTCANVYTHISITSIPETVSKFQNFSRYGTMELARHLLGKKLVRILDGEKLSGLIVETEAYLGVIDKSCHCYNGRKTAKTETMFMPAGTSYVYNIYFKYCCFNISSVGKHAILTFAKYCTIICYNVSLDSQSFIGYYRNIAITTTLYKFNLSFCI